MRGYQDKKPVNEGMNAVHGARIDYWVKSITDSSKVTISFFNRHNIH